MIFPAPLKNNSVIGICCLGGFLAFEKIIPTIQLLEILGYKVVVGKTITQIENDNYFSGNEAERLLDFQNMLDDKNIECIIFGRGGYGMSHIIDKINWQKFIEKPKWIAGFSDITLLLSHINANFNIACLHSPMAKSLSNNETEAWCVNQFVKTLKGDFDPIVFYHNTTQKNQNIKAEIVGGNLSLLAHGIGTVSEINTKNKILFIEDLDEQFYHIERMLIQLKRANKLSPLKALLVGHFTNLKDTQRSFGKKLQQLVTDVCVPYNFPILFNLPLGHEPKNATIIIGATYTLAIENEKAKLSVL